MTGRPEAGGGGGLPDEWGDYGDRDHGVWFEFSDDRTVQRHQRDHLPEHRDRNERTELTVTRYEPNDRVRSTSDVGRGVFGTKVPRGTEGRVVSTREGVFTSYVTVQFVNGYTEEVKKSDLRKLGWLD